MHSPMSGAAPSLAPEPLPPRTQTTGPRPHPPRRWPWVLGAVLAVLSAAAWWLLRAPAETAQPPGASAIRTATVASGSVFKTLRVTGTTAAEKYVALVTPRLRGRGFGRTQAREFRSGQNTNTVVQSNARPSSSGGVSSSGTVQSTLGNSTTGGSSAFRAATSRVNRSSSTTRTTGGASASAAGSATAGLGSTSESLMSGGGGGGGGGGAFDFLLVLQKLARPGSMVKKGEIVGEFDRQNMLLRVDEFRAAVEQTEASFRKFQAELEVGRKAHAQTIEAAKADLEKARLDMKTAPVLSAIEAERARLALEEAEARYKQLLAEVKFVEAGMQAQVRNAGIDLQQAQIELRRAEANADRMLIRSPLSGLAVVQNTFRGSEFAQIQEGDQLFPGMMFMQVVDQSSMVIDAAVNQVDVERVRIGQRATVRFDAFPGLELPAHVYSIGAITRPGGARAQFVKEIPIRLRLDAMDPRVIPDLSVSADIVLEAEENATTAPLAAVHSGDGGKGSVMFVRQGGGWEQRPVELGLADNLLTAVRSGVRKGEVVALERPGPQSRKR